MSTFIVLHHSEFTELENARLTAVLNKLSEYGVDCNEAIDILDVEQGVKIKYIAELDIST